MKESFRLIKRLTDDHHVQRFVERPAEGQADAVWVKDRNAPFADAPGNPGLNDNIFGAEIMADIVKILPRLERDGKLADRRFPVSVSGFGLVARVEATFVGNRVRRHDCTFGATARKAIQERPDVEAKARPTNWNAGSSETFREGENRDGKKARRNSEVF